MAEFIYRARNRHGEISEGRVEAPGLGEALARLDALEYLPITIKRTVERRLRMPVMPLSKKVSQKALIVFTRQLATMMKAGLPILTALTALFEESDNKYLKAVISNIRADIREGLSLSESMERHPRLFSKLYTSSISAGEAGGVLDRVLRRLAELLEHEEELKTSIKSALRYPLIVTTALTVAFLILTTFVVPAFSVFYVEAGADLPIPTQILIAVNVIVRHWWFVVIPAAVLLVFMLKLYVRTSAGRYHWDYLKLKLPVFGSLIIKSISARFAQIFRTLDDAGLNVLKSLDEIADTLGNEVISRDVSRVREAVQDGRGIGPPLLDSKYFPPLLGHMVVIGERSGEMGDMLQSVQEHYDMEVKVIIKNMTVLIEPFLIFGLGLVVLFIALGIFLPMWDLIGLYLR